MTRNRKCITIPMGEATCLAWDVCIGSRVEIQMENGFLTGTVMWITDGPPYRLEFRPIGADATIWCSTHHIAYVEGDDPD